LGKKGEAMVASPLFWVLVAASTAMLLQANRSRYKILFNSIQPELYCPCSSIVLYLISDGDKAALGQANRTGEAAVMNSKIAHSDETLVASAREGSRTAFGELVRRHSHRVYGMSFKILKNREDAEDNLQNVFCKAYGKIRQFEGNSQFSTWLVRIAINEALMMLRKRRPEAAAASADEDGAPEGNETRAELRDLRADPERQYLTKELATKALDALHPTLKYTFILQKGEGWTSRELAKAMEITPELVKSRIFRARVKLRQRLLALAKPEPMALQN
jgi:RNA polymerase sigma-70 factor (ECF subfamily)